MMTYEEWLAQYREQFDANRFRWERLFADQVLKRLDELDFTYVKYQRKVDIDGQARYRVDFTIELPDLAPLAIEVNGATKYDGGTRPPTAREKGDEELRRRALNMRFAVIEFANSETEDRPEKCASDLRELIAKLRANQKNEAIEDKLSAIQQAIGELGYGGLSEADQERLSAAERESAKAKKAAKQSLRESAEIRSKLDAMERREATSPPNQQSVNTSRTRLYAGGAVVLVVVAIGLWLLLSGPEPPPGQTASVAAIAAPAALCTSGLTSADVLAQAQDGAVIDVRGTVAEVKGSYINIDTPYAKGMPGVAIHLDSAAGDPPPVGTPVAASGLADLQKEAGRVVINVDGVADVLDCS